MNFPKKMYIDGALVAGSGQKDVINPATEEVIATIATAGFADVERALLAAEIRLYGLGGDPY